MTEEWKWMPENGFATCIVEDESGVKIELDSMYELKWRTNDEGKVEIREGFVMNLSMAYPSAVVCILNPTEMQALLNDRGHEFSRNALHEATYRAKNMLELLGFGIMTPRQAELVQEASTGLKPAGIAGVIFKKIAPRAIPAAVSELGKGP